MSRVADSVFEPMLAVDLYWLTPFPPPPHPTPIQSQIVSEISQRHVKVASLPPHLFPRIIKFNLHQLRLRDDEQNRRTKSPH